MCEFCHKHGEGKKWYLQAQNYSEDLLSDLRRRKFIGDFFIGPELKSERGGKRKYRRLPRFVVDTLEVNRRKKTHFGQVVPIEEIERIFSLVNSVTRIACYCRQITLGTEQRYCYLVSMAPPEESEFNKILRSIDADYLTGPKTSGLEYLSKEIALKSIMELEKNGLCHSIWTFITPFIGGICNCDRSDCLAMQQTVTLNMPDMFRAEYVARVNPELCNGCRQCMRVCQFGAMGFSAANEKVIIDLRRCYGCGICRASCTKNAIVLNERSAVPLASHLW